MIAPTLKAGSRDLKPDSVAEDGHAKLPTFGMAKLNSPTKLWGRV